MYQTFVSSNATNTSDYSPQWNPEDMNKEEAIAYFNVIIRYIALAIFVYGLMIVLVCQTLFVACINRLNHNQLRLEAIFASGYQAPTAVNPTGVIYRQNIQLI